MSSQINKVMEEIGAIERVIKPYEYYIIEASESLGDLAAIRVLLNKPTRPNLMQAVEKLKAVESRVNRYRGYNNVKGNGKGLLSLS